MLETLIFIRTSFPTPQCHKDSSCDDDADVGGPSEVWTNYRPDDATNLQHSPRATITEKKRRNNLESFEMKKISFSEPGKVKVKVYDKHRNDCDSITSSTFSDMSSSNAFRIGHSKGSFVGENFLLHRLRLEALEDRPFQSDSSIRTEELGLDCNELSKLSKKRIFNLYTKLEKSSKEGTQKPIDKPETTKILDTNFGKFV